MRSLTRREFLTLSTGTLLLSQCRRGESRNITAESSSPAIDLPEAHISQQGGLEVDLEASYRPVDVGGKIRPVLCYNGQIPGPRLEVRPGDAVKIHFTNALPASTNLHFHGLHIPPTGGGDDVFREVRPGETALYEFRIPDPHPGGLAYYHPHWHGTVADQILGGLGGVIVVRNELDAIAEIQAADEEIIFLKDFVEDQPITGLMAGREGGLVTVNGRHNPLFSMSSGGLKRLRLINASNAKFYRLAIEEHAMILIATDGYALPQPQRLSELLLSPGERADVLVQGTQSSGKYRLLNLPYNRVGMGMMGRRHGGRGMMRGRMHRGRRSPEQTSETLATLVYSGERDVLPLPAQLIQATPPSAPEQQRTFSLNHGMVPGRGMMFLINGKPFEHDRIDTQVSLGTVEDWEIINTGVMDHPFHLHTNAFQVMEHNGEPLKTPQWKDTVLVKRGDRIKIRIPFNDYPGKTVYHCHILDHEELGMMGTLDMQTD